MSTELHFVETGPGGVDVGDEVLADSAWARRLDRLLPPQRGRALLVALAAVVTVATFGGTAASRGRVAASPSPPAASTAAAVTPAPADVNVCSYESVYVEDPLQPGVRPYEVLFCPSTRTAGHPIRTK